MPELPKSSVEQRRMPTRYELDCDECSFQTYGNDEYLTLGREHVEETGHTVRVKASYWTVLSRVALAAALSTFQETGDADG